MNDAPPPLADLLAQRDQLLLEKEQNNEVLASCRAQIATAKARQIERHEYANAEWWRAVHSRASHAGQDDQRIARRLSELKQLIRAANIREARDGVPTSDDPILALLLGGLKQIQQAVDLLRAKENADDHDS